MPNKEKVLESLTNKNYSYAEVKHLINTISRESTQSTLRKGDVIKLAGSGPKCRPAVIIKVLKEYVLVMPMSTTKDSLTLIAHNSRFFEAGYINKSVVTVPLHYAQNNFLGVLDQSTVVNKAVKMFKEYINKII